VTVGGQHGVNDTEVVPTGPMDPDRPLGSMASTTQTAMNTVSKVGSTPVQEAASQEPEKGSASLFQVSKDAENRALAHHRTRGETLGQRQQQELARSLGLRRRGARPGQVVEVLAGRRHSSPGEQRTLTGWLLGRGTLRQ
jgi:hypothetical protein